jgi:organizing structure protein 2
MARSFYADEEEQYSTPGLPTVTHIQVPKPITKNETSNTEIKINEFGNLIATAPGLEKFVSKIRKTTTEYYEEINEKYEFYTGTAKSHFGMTVDKIADFKGENENLLPNICTVLTSTLVGSIFARNHSLPIRFFTPVLFGAVALKYSLPNTFANVSGGFSNVGLAIERKYFPDFKETRENGLQKTQEVYKNAEQLKLNLWDGLVQNVSYARKSICGAICSEKKD